MRRFFFKKLKNRLKLCKIWQVYGHERVQQVLNSMIGNNNVKNPIGNITHILKAKGYREAGATALEQLLPQFASTREKFPD